MFLVMLLVVMLLMVFVMMMIMMLMITMIMMRMLEMFFACVQLLLLCLRTRSCTILDLPSQACR